MHTLSDEHRQALGMLRLRTGDALDRGMTIENQLGFEAALISLMWAGCADEHAGPNRGAVVDMFHEYLGRRANGGSWCAIFYHYAVDHASEWLGGDDDVRTSGGAIQTYKRAAHGRRQVFTNEQIQTMETLPRVGDYIALVRDPDDMGDALNINHEHYVPGHAAMVVGFRVEVDGRPCVSIDLESMASKLTVDNWTILTSEGNTIDADEFEAEGGNAYGKFLDPHSDRVVAFVRPQFIGRKFRGS